jgi:hypothetical protein
MKGKGITAGGFRIAGLEQSLTAFSIRIPQSETRNLK